jgi:signal transduction histidine kinase
MLKKKSLYILNLVLILIVFALYFLYIYKPSEDILKTKLEEDFKNKMLLKTHLIENVVSRYVEGAKSISSRTMIRNKLIEYKHGKTSFEELRDYSQSKYEDGIKALNNCVYAARYVDNVILVKYDTDTILNIEKYTSLDLHTSEIVTNIQISADSLLTVTVISPIYYNNIIYGYDMLISRCSKLLTKISNKNERLQIREIEKNENSKLRDTLININDSLLFKTTSNYSNSLYIFSKANDIVYEELFQFRKRQIRLMGLILFVLLLITFAIQKRTQLFFLRKSSILENLIKEKTQHLDMAINRLKQVNEQLKKREDELLKINQTKDKFFSIIAHDLKNPISALLGLFEIMIDRPDSIPEEQKNKLTKNIYDSAKQLFRLLENLLAWSRAQSSKIVLKPGNMSIKEIIDDTIYIQKNHALSKSIIIKNNIDTNASAFADYNTISTVFRNLISNAIKFTKEDGEIIIDYQKQKNKIQISVKDCGIGMSDEVLENLFRIDIKTSTPGTNNEIGTGLGLILCKEFVEMNNGSISVKSKINEGSTFLIELPISE